MKVFGPDPAHATIERVDVPVGKACVYCSAVFGDSDSGFTLPYYSGESDEVRVEEVSYHRACLMKNLFGEDG